MVTERKATGRASSMPGGLAIGALVSMGITLVMASAIAWLVDKGKLPLTGIGYGAMVTLFLGAAAGALVASGKIKRMRMQVCLLAGLIYFLLLLSMTALFFGGQYHGIGVTAAVVAGGAVTAILPGLRQSRGGKKRYRTRASR